MGLGVLVLGIVLAIAVVAAAIKVGKPVVIGAGALLAVGILFCAFALGSVRFIGADEVGIVKKNALGPKLKAGKIIATEGEMGVQAEVLSPGWHFFYWPVIFDVDTVQVTVVPQGQVGLLTAVDGLPLPEGQTYAPEFAENRRQDMLRAEFFLGEGKGHKGPQSTVLTPGKHRLNTALFQVEMVPATIVPKATAAVVKSNVGAISQDAASVEGRLVGDDEQGIRRRPLTEGAYYLNTRAYEVTMISLSESIVEFTKERSASGPGGMEREITVRTSDGFEFPVDIRVVYKILAEDAPTVVARLQDDRDGLRKVLQSAVRAIFRNNAQDVKALDYVQQRSQQEVRSTEMLAKEMTTYGVTITAVRINDLGDDSERWQSLMKTQTDREIALQEQITFQEQQRAAEQRKALTRTEQEAEEERRLATASYEVQIAEQQKQQQIIQASAEAEAIAIRAKAQAEAFAAIAAEIGRGNAALVELLKIVGERGIEITPRVMVTGGGSGSGADPETTALIGTMLDSMMDKRDADIETRRREAAVSN